MIRILFSIGAMALGTNRMQERLDLSQRSPKALLTDCFFQFGRLPVADREAQKYGLGGFPHEQLLQEAYPSGNRAIFF